MNTGRKRKGRKDRTHLIYELTIGKATYVGLTFLRDQSVPKTMRARIKQHWYNAHNHGKPYKLPTAIRKLDSIDAISYKIVAKVRGKVEAHQAERQIITTIKPKLNSDIRTRAA